jgi:hypothetical protein
MISLILINLKYLIYINYNLANNLCQGISKKNFALGSIYNI